MFYIKLSNTDTTELTNELLTQIGAPTRDDHKRILLNLTYNFAFPRAYAINEDRVIIVTKVVQDDLDPSEFDIQGQVLQMVEPDQPGKDKWARGHLSDNQHVWVNIIAMENFLADAFEGYPRYLAIDDHIEFGYTSSYDFMLKPSKNKKPKLETIQ